MDADGFVQITWGDTDGTLVSDRAPKKVVPAPSGPSLRDELPKHVGELRARAMKLAKNPTLADDIVQETFERALRFEARYERGTNVRAWLYQVLFSVFVTGYRKRKREARAFTRFEVEARSATMSSAHDAVQMLSPGTMRALDAMPPAFREVLMLVDVCDLSYRDVATELDVPLGTVMSRLHRARKLAADLLAA